jgi:hypothetical protein
MRIKTRMSELKEIKSNQEIVGGPLNKKVQL